MYTVEAGDMNEFDFLIGSWTVVNRQLDKLFVGCEDWSEYTATSEAHTVMDGIGNFDQMLFPSGKFGATLRLFDIETEEWTLYWTNSKGKLFPGITGRFDGPRGVFEGLDSHEGETVKARFIWTGTDTETPRWEQEYSNDGGKTWERNWVMEFARR